MALISDILDRIDRACTDAITASAFTDMVDSILPLFQIGMVLTIALIGVNLATQLIPTTFSKGLWSMFKIAIISAFLFSFDNFSTVFNAVTNTPAELGSVVVEALGINTTGNLYNDLDNIFETTTEIGTTISQNGGYVAGKLAGLLIFVITSLMAVSVVFVLGTAKILLTLMYLLAPFMIAATIFPQTFPLFEAWVKQIIGLALTPLLVTGMAGVIVLVFNSITDSSIAANATVLADIVSFLVVSLLGTLMIMSVPSTASAMAATSLSLGMIATGGLQSAMSKLDSMKNTGKSLSKAAGGAAGGAAASKIAELSSKSTSKSGKALNSVARAAERKLAPQRASHRALNNLIRK